MSKRRAPKLPPAPPITLVPGETLADFERLRERWYEEFPPNSDLETEFVERLCERRWLLQRCERLYDDAVAKILLAQPDATAWPAATHKLLQTLDRYRLTAERAWRAAWRDLETLLRNRFNAVAIEQRLIRMAWFNQRHNIGPHNARKAKPRNPNQENLLVQTKQEPPPERRPQDPDPLQTRDRHLG